MDTQQNTNKDIPSSSPPPHGAMHSSRMGRMMGGMVIVGVGAVLLARQAGADLPHWLISWQMFLIALGIFVGARQSFRDFGWLILVAIGTVFLLDDFVENMSIGQFFWPVIIILIGLVMIFKPRRGNSDHYWKRWEKNHTPEHESAEDHLECVTVFGGVKKNIISKNFRGGENVNVFGGTELNLMQADIDGRIVLELVQVFGGTKLIVPPHWKIQAEGLVSIFGGLNDKRPLPAEIPTENKVIVLKGTCIFGGIDIKSY